MTWERNWRRRYSAGSCRSSTIDPRLNPECQGWRQGWQPTLCPPESQGRVASFHAFFWPSVSPASGARGTPGLPSCLANDSIRQDEAPWPSVVSPTKMLSLSPPQSCPELPLPFRGLPPVASTQELGLVPRPARSGKVLAGAVGCLRETSCCRPPFSS